MKKSIDLVAGTIGLRYHRQFVIELLAESLIVYKEKGEPTQTIAGQTVEVLETLALNEDGTASVTKFLHHVGSAPAAARDFGVTALTWLLRAWCEIYSFSKFMSLFIPLEVVLSKYLLMMLRFQNEKELTTGSKRYSANMAATIRHR